MKVEVEWLTTWVSREPGLVMEALVTCGSTLWHLSVENYPGEESASILFIPPCCAGEVDGTWENFLLCSSCRSVYKSGHGREFVEVCLDPKLDDDYLTAQDRIDILEAWASAFGLDPLSASLMASTLMDLARDTVRNLDTIDVKSIPFIAKGGNRSQGYAWVSALRTAWMAKPRPVAVPCGPSEVPDFIKSSIGMP